MTILSFENNFIFVKTRKVAGTSVEAALRPYTGPDDIVPCVTPRDEYYSAVKGHYSKNYAANPDDEKRYTELVLEKRFEEAMSFLKDMDKKHNSHMKISRIKRIVEERGLRLDDFYKFSIERHPYNWVISSVSYSNRKYHQGTLEPMEPQRISALLERKLADPSYLQARNWDMYAQGDKLLVDSLIRYEDLEDELVDTLRKIGLDASALVLPDLKTNVRHLDPDAILTKDMKTNIQMRFSKVFNVMGYVP